MTGLCTQDMLSLDTKKRHSQLIMFDNTTDDDINYAIIGYSMLLQMTYNMNHHQDCSTKIAFVEDTFTLS